jgi:hypothetical protein
MTADRAALVDRVAWAICTADGIKCDALCHGCKKEASAALDIALEEAARVADQTQKRQAELRDDSLPESADWQVYNQGVFVAGTILRTIRSLKSSA